MLNTYTHYIRGNNMTDPEVDSTSLSSASIERRNSLEKHLQLRPEPQDLRERHILVGEGVAPYVAPLYTDCVCEVIHTLCLNYIYTPYAVLDDTDIVVNICRDPNPQQTLQRRRTSESLQRHLAQRPEREELIERMSLPYPHLGLSPTQYKYRN